MGAGVSAVPAVNELDPVDGEDRAESLTVDDRRREPRRSGVVEHGIQSARVRPGIDVCLLDVSAEGALIETAYRLLPGRRLDLQLSFATGTVAIRGSCAAVHSGPRIGRSHRVPRCPGFRPAVALAR